jgi:pyruvate ferredoxin oxidoreductase delta subunit
MKINIVAKPATSLKNKTGGWRTLRPKINYNKCTSAGICAKVCPEGAITMEPDKNGRLIPIINYDYCKGCGICVLECPEHAFTLELDKK